MWSVRIIALQHSSNLHRKLWFKQGKIAGRQERENHLFCTCDVVTGLDKLKFAAIYKNIFQEQAQLYLLRDYVRAWLLVIQLYYNIKQLWLRHSSSDQQENPNLHFEAFFLTLPLLSIVFFTTLLLINTSAKCLWLYCRILKIQYSYYKVYLTLRNMP